MQCSQLSIEEKNFMLTSITQTSSEWFIFFHSRNTWHGDILIDEVNHHFLLHSKINTFFIRLWTYWCTDINIYDFFQLFGYIKIFKDKNGLLCVKFMDCSTYSIFWWSHYSSMSVFFFTGVEWFKHKKILLALYINLMLLKNNFSPAFILFLKK